VEAHLFLGGSGSAGGALLLLAGKGE